MKQHCLLLFPPPYGRVSTLVTLIITALVMTPGPSRRGCVRSFRIITVLLVLVVVSTLVVLGMSVNPVRGK